MIDRKKIAALGLAATLLGGAALAVHAQGHAFHGMGGPEGMTGMMEKHAEIGWEILRDIDFLGDAKLVVRHHHERWDGQGYPDGLAGEAIPLAARVFAVADALDALTSDRPYRSASSFATARREVCSKSGTQFDPAVVAAYRGVPDTTFEALREAL